MLKALILAFSFYTRLPMPLLKNADKSMKYVLSWFPMTGVILGLLQAASLLVMREFDIPILVMGILLTVIPVIYTGGIHLDGFMDTTDAVMSYKPREEKIKIMDDPHAGAFSIIGICVYLMCSVSLYTVIFDRSMRFLEESTCSCIIYIGCVFVISRALSAITSMCLPKAKKEGMLYMLTGDTARGLSYVLPFIFLTAGLLIQIRADILAGIVNAAFQLLLFLHYRKKCAKEFGGITGDTAGWYLCRSEMVSLFSLALVLIIGG